MKKYLTLVEVDETKTTIFSSNLEKMLFIQTHKEGEYRFTLNGNAAEESLYIIIDTRNRGFVLNNSGITYNEAQTLIKMYE